MSSIEGLSRAETGLRRLIRLLRSPIISILTRATATGVFVADLPETAKKWWFALFFLFADVIVGIADIVVRLPRWLISACKLAIEALGRWCELLRRAADRADRVLGESRNNNKI